MQCRFHFYATQVHFCNEKRSLSVMRLLIFTFVCIASAAFSQNTASISGTVFDENNAPLPYATVYFKNTTNGTTTNANGYFKLNGPEGKTDLVVQYIGYKQVVQSVELGAKTKSLRIKMEPSDLALAEVVINGEDPAYRIMREAIARRAYYHKKVEQYSVEVYIKGFYKMLDAPKKIFGKDIGDMGGVLDTNRTGVLYLAESVSKVYAQFKPERKKEVMISSKVSGGAQAYSMNRATLTDFDLYNERINVDRDILSPLADNAFSYYNFKFIGSYKDPNGYEIEKIQVTPKRNYDPVFSGFVYIVDGYWNLAGLDLALTGNAIKQPILDTMRIRQEFALIEKPDTWRLLSQITSFKFGILGFKIGGFYNGVFSGYNLQEPAIPGIFDKEQFRVEPLANQRDTMYWNRVRPVPLTPEEVRDYTRKDSIYQVHNSKAYLDSVDHKRNRFSVNSFFNGYTWRNTYKKTTLNFPGISQWIQFNAVQGLAGYFKPSYTKTNEQAGKSISVKADLNYGLQEKRFRASAALERKFESIHNTTLYASGGVAPVQYNPDDPIGPGLNALYSLYGKKSYMKLYEKTFGQLAWSRHLDAGILLKASTEWNERVALENHSNYSLRFKDREYPSNNPLSGKDGLFFSKHQALWVQLEAHFYPGETYETYPDKRTYVKSAWPEFTVSYKKALPNLLGSDVDYDLLRGEIKKTDLSWGLAGYSDLLLQAGIFLRHKSMEFADYQHFMGNQTWFGKGNTLDAFYLLPYYDYSTADKYVALHAQHHLQGWLLDKIPGIRRLNWKEVFGVQMLWTPGKAPGASDRMQNMPYWEVNAGFENIGFKIARPLRIDVVNSFRGNQYDKIGIVLSISL